MSIMILPLWAPPALRLAAADCPSVDAIGMVFYPLECVPADDGDPTVPEDVKDLLEFYIDELIGAGVDITKGSDSTGAWDCTVDGATIWIYLDDPISPQSAGATFSETDIALNWNSFFDPAYPPNLDAYPEYFSELISLLFHELYHTVFLEWLTGTCQGSPSCVEAWKCIHQQTPEHSTNPCFEFFAYSETSRDLCAHACSLPPGSELRNELITLSTEQAEEADMQKDACDALVVAGDCPAPPFPPSSFGPPGQAPGVPPPCCCQDGAPIECENCNEATGECDD